MKPRPGTQHQGAAMTKIKKLDDSKLFGFFADLTFYAFLTVGAVAYGTMWLAGYRQGPDGWGKPDNRSPSRTPTPP